MRRWHGPRSRRLWGEARLLQPRIQELADTYDMWLAEVQDPQQRHEFERRLRGRSDDAHLSAVEELALHHEFVMRNYGIERDPEMVGSTSRPDFRIRTRHGSAIVEAAAARSSQQRQEMDGRLAALVDDLEAVRSDLHILATPTTPLPRDLKPSVIRRFLECELADGWPTGSEDSERAYRTPDGAVEIVFNAFRDSEEAEGEGTVTEEDTPAAIKGLGYAIARTVEAPDRIRAAVLGKARRYGELREPYVICVFNTADFRSLEAEFSALIGSRRWIVDMASHQAHEQRELDGLLLQHQAGQPTYSRVSAVVMLDETAEWGGPIRHVFRVYHNPFATFPLPTLVWEGWPQYVSRPESSTMAWQDPPGPPKR